MNRQLAWSYAAHAVGLILPPVTLIFLARLLTPEDFGIFAIVLVVVVGLQSIVLTPMTEVIVRSANEDVAEYVLPVILGSGLLLSLLVLGTATVIASWLDMPQAASAMSVSAVLLVVSPLLETAIKLNVRAINFRLVFVRRLVTPFGNAAVAIPLAMAGLGYWALVFGQIAGIVTALVFVLWFGSWRPRMRFDFSCVSSDMAFSLQMLLQGSMVWVRSQSDKLFVATAASASELGHFSLSRQISGMAYAVIVDPVQTFSYAVMSAEHRRGQKIAQFYCTVVRRILLITVPMTIVLFANREMLVALLLGSQWLPMAEYFGIFLLPGLLGTWVAMNLGVFKALGRPGVMTVFILVRGIATLIAFALAVQHGPMAIAMAALALALLFSPINVWITLRELALPVTSYVRTVLILPAVFGIVTAALVAISTRNVSGIVGELVSIIIIGLLVCIAFVAIERPFRRHRPALDSKTT